MNNSEKIYTTDLRVLLTKEMKLSIKKFAEKEKISQGEFVRNIIEAKINKDREVK